MTTCTFSSMFCFENALKLFRGRYLHSVLIFGEHSKHEDWVLLWRAHRNNCMSNSFGVFCSCFVFVFVGFFFWQKWARERITPDLQAISKCSFHFHSNAWSIFWTEVVFFKQMRNTSVLFMLHHTSHATSYIFVIQLGHVFKNKCWFCESAFAISSLTHLKKAHFSNLRLFLLSDPADGLIKIEDTQNHQSFWKKLCLFLNCIGSVRTDKLGN